MRQCAILLLDSRQHEKGELLSVVGSLIVAYLFLGGAGAGAALILVCVDSYYMRTGAAKEYTGEAGSTLGLRNVASVLKRGYSVSFVVLALGIVCLLSDLGRPELAYILFTNPTVSYINIGAYSLAVLSAGVLFLAVLENFVLPPFLTRLKPLALLVGGLAAIFVMVYTGVFLQSMNAVALWDSALLILLFFLSALSTGVAIVLLCSSGLHVRRADTRFMQGLSKLDLATIVLELIVCALYLAMVSEGDIGVRSVERLLLGDYSAVFIGGFLLCGLIVPGILNGAAALGRTGERVNLAIAFLVLIGGFCLRLSIVNAGIHSSI